MTTKGLAAGAQGLPDEPTTLAHLATQLEAERAGLERELAEMGMLLQQAQTEADRHETRATQAAERLTQLEDSKSTAPAELREARGQALLQARRAALMASQVQVLEGKQKTMRRFEERLRKTVERIGGLEPASTDAGFGAGPAGSARAVLAAQEHMRREIARQMHDGPAQSIANIALQAQVVRQLLHRDPGRAENELVELGAMVQHALEATKNFIFDVRPMVLDDLGIVPTLRRSARERAQRTGVAIRFESVGADRRLEAELESSLFRIVDDAVTGFLLGRPEEIQLRLDWTDRALQATVHSQATAEGGQAIGEEVAEGAAGEAMPAALAAMIDDQRTRERAGAAARRQARALPPKTWSEIQARAAWVGFTVRLDEEGRLLQVDVPVPVQ